MQIEEKEECQGRICSYILLSENHVLFKCLGLAIRNHWLSENSGVFLLRISMSFLTTGISCLKSNEWGFLY